MSLAGRLCGDCYLITCIGTSIQLWAKPSDLDLLLSHAVSTWNWANRWSRRRSRLFSVRKSAISTRVVSPASLFFRWAFSSRAPESRSFKSAFSSSVHSKVSSARPSESGPRERQSAPARLRVRRLSAAHLAEAPFAMPACMHSTEDGACGSRQEIKVESEDLKVS